MDTPKRESLAHFGGVLQALLLGCALVGCSCTSRPTTKVHWNPVFPGALVTEAEFVDTVGVPSTVEIISHDIPAVEAPSVRWTYDLISASGEDEFQMIFYFKDGVCVYAPVMRFNASNPYRIFRKGL